MEINGIAHIIVAVSRFDECMAFYRRLLPFLGLTRIVHDRDEYFYCIGGRTGFGISRAASKYKTAMRPVTSRASSRSLSCALARGRRYGLETGC